jgi:PAS domain S-box-containing protein
MPAPEVNIIWFIVIGMLVLMILGVAFIVSIVISQRRLIVSQYRMLDELERGERRFKDLFTHAIEGIYQSTPDGQYMSINPALARIYGYASPEEMLANVTNIGQQIYADPKRRVEFMRLLEEQGEVRNFQYEARRKDGAIIWISGNARAVRDKHGVLIYYEGTVEDITNQKRAEELLRRIPRRILEAQESERARIARELHDSIGQLLSSARMRFQGSFRSIKLLHRNLFTSLEQIDMLIQRALEEVRRISYNLRLGELHDLGLAAALTSMCEELQQRSHVTITLFTPRVPYYLSEEVQLTVYRVVQESLNNIEKHARASHVSITLAVSDSLLELTITDDGMGFERSRSNGGLGLVGIQERVALLEGVCDITSNPGRGSNITVRIPFASPSERMAI